MTAGTPAGLRSLLEGWHQLEVHLQSVTPGGNVSRASRPQQPAGVGRVSKVLNANRPASRLPSGARPGLATCT